MTIIDDLTADARVQHVGVSPAGRAVMARTELDEDKLGQLVRSFPPEERRAFWLGVLLRDGAISVQVALTSRTAPPPRPTRRADPPPGHGGPAVPTVRGRVRGATASWPATDAL